MDDVMLLATMIVTIHTDAAGGLHHGEEDSILYQKNVTQHLCVGRVQAFCGSKAHMKHFHAAQAADVAATFRMIEKEIKEVMIQVTTTQVTHKVSTQTKLVKPGQAGITPVGTSKAITYQKGAAMGGGGKAMGKGKGST